MAQIYSIFDPWDHVGVSLAALFLWIMVDSGLVAGALLFENHGLSTICAVLAIKVFFEQNVERIKLIIEAWKKHKSLTERAKGEK